MSRVTQADIAKALGLSPATVALVVGKSNSHLRNCVKKETAERIRKKAKELGYQPNRAAQMVRSGRSNTIVHLNWGGHSELAQANCYQIGRFIHEAGFDYQRVDSYFWPDEGPRIIERIMAFQPEGIIISGILQTEIDWTIPMQAGIPIVGLKTRDEGIPSIWDDGYTPFAEMTRYCLENGRNPMVLVMEDVTESTSDRCRGFYETVREITGTDVVKEWQERDLKEQKYDPISGPGIFYIRRTAGAFDLFLDGMRATEKLLKTGLLPDALLCVNDHFAIGAVTVLLRAGVRIPEDVWVLGFDNLTYTTQGTVTVTSVEQPIEAMCESAITLLVQRIQKIKGTVSIPRKKVKMLHPCKIHWRESTGHSSPPAYSTTILSEYSR